LPGEAAASGRTRCSTGHIPGCPVSAADTGAYADSVRWRLRRAGRVEAAHRRCRLGLLHLAQALIVFSDPLAVPQQYDHDVVSFLESAGVTFVAAFLAACWHVLSRNEKPEAQELAVGFDLMVATMVLQSGFLPGSRGLGLDFRWAGLVLLFVMLTAMAVATKMFGYEQSSSLRRREGSGRGTRYIPVDRMTGKTAWGTSIAGSAMLCVFWWLNVNLGLVVAAWKEIFH
jgi:hypothetical protein